LEKELFNMLINNDFYKIVARDVSQMAAKTVYSSFQFGLKFEFSGRSVNYLQAFILPHRGESPEKEFKRREKFHKPDFQLP